MDEITEREGQMALVVVLSIAIGWLWGEFAGVSAFVLLTLLWIIGQPR